MGKIIDGKAIAAGLYDQMRQEVEQMEVKYGRRPGLTVGRFPPWRGATKP